MRRAAAVGSLIVAALMVGSIVAPFIIAANKLAWGTISVECRK